MKWERGRLGRKHCGLARSLSPSPFRSLACPLIG